MVGEAIVKRGGVRAVESGSTASKYKRSMVRTVCKVTAKQCRWHNIAEQGGALHVSKRVILDV